jgi:hypothetical protein
MGAETSSPIKHLEDGAPLQPHPRSRGQPKHESHGSGEIDEVVDRVFVSGLAGALNFPMLHQRGLKLHPNHFANPLAPQLLAKVGVSPCGPSRQLVRAWVVDPSMGGQAGLARPRNKPRDDL